MFTIKDASDQGKATLEFLQIQIEESRYVGSPVSGKDARDAAETLLSLATQSAKLLKYFAADLAGAEETDDAPDESDDPVKAKDEGDIRAMFRNLATRRLHWPVLATRHSRLAGSPEDIMKYLTKIQLGEKAGLKLDRTTRWSVSSKTNRWAYHIWSTLENARLHGTDYPTTLQETEWFRQAQLLPPLDEDAPKFDRWWPVAKSWLKSYHGENWQSVFPDWEDAAKKRANQLSTGFSDSFFKSQIATFIKEGWKSIAF